MDFIKGFKEGVWYKKAKEYLQDPDKIKKLLKDVPKYLSKESLTEVKNYIVLMYDYIRDIVNGKYKDYDGWALAEIVACMIYLVSPIDLIPDLLPGGLIDDASVIIWVFNNTKSELDKYRIWRG